MISTAFIALVSWLIIVFNLMWTIGFGAWIDQEALFYKMDNPKVKVIKQIEDVGAFGYGISRIVKVTSVTKFFNIIDEVDTLELNKKAWISLKD